MVAILGFYEKHEACARRFEVEDLASELNNEITTLLTEWSQGDVTALDRLAPLVYPQLRLIAASYLRREDRGHIARESAMQIR